MYTLILVKTRSTIIKFIVSHRWHNKDKSSRVVNDQSTVMLVIPEITVLSFAFCFLISSLLLFFSNIFNNKAKKRKDVARTDYKFDSLIFGF